ncbi:hypothetical protein N474_22480 [Pseudoalteromonas luteoviolacea CPMOR-2]|uniref:Lipoprotein n=1 Tax=Pseudoalteromonas luteoviolacea DSM 6061 TaxID=1365250 RepID=A0A166VWM8_9GAMM|nr:hypothetical protein [Pseudoalteromonas luteoviolacea]KZN34091.1 hypothetical protein N475_19240 [Pseudoalteromonas luteoviolacea DSM 6061]KZN52739.1 hypothetical protein N474_22480 [Pseudoalteromonas luteoviolacea CPMOR-2]MBE0389686.1 hypothetical protein [Pseudoalteromonas luteoviolacea DSM 6061]
MKQLKLSASALVVSTLLLGCSTSTTESENVKTEAIWADIYVTTQGESSRVIAELNVSSRNGNNIQLSDKDKLEARAAGVTKELEQDDDFFDIDYRAVFNIAEKDTQFSVRLVRGESNETLETTLKLPAPFTIITPQKNQSFFRKETLEINWTPDDATDTSLDLALTITCKNNEGNDTSTGTTVRNIDDDGSYSINLESLDGLVDPLLNTKKMCEGQVFMERIRHGVLDSKFADSSRARAIQERYSDKFEVRLEQ